MSRDPIVAEIRQIREEFAREFNFDLRAMHEDLKRQEKSSGRTIVSFVSPVEQHVEGEGASEPSTRQRPPERGSEDALPMIFDIEEVEALAQVEQLL